MLPTIVDDINKMQISPQVPFHALRKSIKFRSIVTSRLPYFRMSFLFT